MTTVFINGTFDILHRGHIELFRHASEIGDSVIVAIDSDSRVRKLKGPTRPFNNQVDRKFILLSLSYIDDVYVFHNNDELIELVRTINPDFMIVGSDWKGKPVIGSQYAKKLEFFERVGEYSTTRILGDRETCS